ncbi:5271_t:CDS:2 [Acaulospora morrowiae]|uniref:5271_t:CDS:1 n=1 Tax=Acaulospora morrowiae TaxID=94023 RepID=A0A9N9GU77_9GLOM|nr:5271_t:CDS:2 [Acaulospora morrowiae]
MELFSYSQKWSSVQCFDVAALCVQIVSKCAWSNDTLELEWKKRFLASVFHYLAISEKEQTVLLAMPGEIDDSTFINLLIGNFKRCEERDIREEVIYDLLLVCLGLAQRSSNGEGMKQSEGIDVKERVDKVISLKKSRERIEAILPSSSEVLSSQIMEPGEYDSRARTFLFKCSKYLEVSESVVQALEKGLAQHLYFMQQQKIKEELKASEVDASIQELHDSASTSLINQEKKKKKWRWMATGVGVVVGATAIGLTGGLAAPLVAAGIGAITGAGIIATTASSVVLMASLFGIAGGGLGGYKMHKRTRGLKEFSFTRIISDEAIPLIPSLYVNIVISGYILEDDNEVTKPWLPTFENTANYIDTFALTFDIGILRSLGRAFRRFLAESAVKVAAQSALHSTVFATLASALLLPTALMKAGDLIDNPWALGVDRAYKAGLVLSDVLCERVQGKRPTVLVGYSLGALVIWSCLCELQKRKKYGLIDSVILIGAPVLSTPVAQWQKVASVVSRRFVNAYATNDIVLGLIYRMHSLSLNVAGLGPVKCDRVENFDITSFTTGHLGYCEQGTLARILNEIGLN